MSAGRRIAELRERMGYSQLEFSRVVNINNSVLSRIESGDRAIRDDEIVRIATALGVTTDYLLGYSSDPALNRKDERDILKKLDSILNEMNSTDALMFDGEEVTMDEESTELLKSSLENSIRLAKKLAKEKYTPKKYKK